MPKAYPVYDEHYKANVDVLAGWLDEQRPQRAPGRAATACTGTTTRTTRCTRRCSRSRTSLGADHDVWAVNVEEEYHETAEGVGPEDAGIDDRRTGPGGTGRDAPIVPRAEYEATRVRRGVGAD